MIYSFVSSPETIGDYTCIVENEIGISKTQLKVVHLPSDLIISMEKLPVYSDAIVFEWSVLSGSPIQELNVQVNGLRKLRKLSKCEQIFTLLNKIGIQ